MMQIDDCDGSKLNQHSFKDNFICNEAKDWKKLVSDKTVCIRVVHEQFHFLKTYTIVSKGSQEACSSAS